MAVLQMLSEVIRAEEFFGLIAFTEFVNGHEMFGPMIPVRRSWKLLAAVSADICRRWVNGRRMERRMHSHECAA